MPETVPFSMPKNVPVSVPIDRRTNGHSKKVGNHAAMLALYYTFYNFARPHMGCGGVSPAQAAGLASRLWKIGDIVGLLEDAERPVYG